MVSSINELTHIKPLPEASNDTPVKEEIIPSTNSGVNKNYRLPPLSLLKDVKNINNTENVKNAKASMELLAKVLNDFEIVWCMTRGGPSHATELVSTYSYIQGFMNSNIAKSVAASLILVPILVVLVHYITKSSLSEE